MLKVKEEGAVCFVFQYSEWLHIYVKKYKEQVIVTKQSQTQGNAHITKRFPFNGGQKELTISGCQETVIWTECQHPNPHFGISPISNRFDVLERDWHLGNVIWN